MGFVGGQRLWLESDVRRHIRLQWLHWHGSTCVEPVDHGAGGQLDDRGQVQRRRRHFFPGGLQQYHGLRLHEHRRRVDHRLL